jgi:hypothetical protein
MPFCASMKKMKTWTIAFSDRVNRKRNCSSSDRRERGKRRRQNKTRERERERERESTYRGEAIEKRTKKKKRQMIDVNCRDMANPVDTTTKMTDLFG